MIVKALPILLSNKIDTEFMVSFFNRSTIEELDHHGGFSLEQEV